MSRPIAVKGAAPIGRWAVLAGGLAVLAAPALADKLDAPRTMRTSEGVTVAVKDLGPRFLDFYHRALHAAPDDRFAIWKERHDFAAVPPTLERNAIARGKTFPALARISDAALPGIVLDVIDGLIPEAGSSSQPGGLP